MVNPPLASPPAFIGTGEDSPSFRGESATPPALTGANASPPALMGVLNLTPDSFSDGGSYATPTQAIDRAQQMMADGAALVDVGAESSRPGAPEVSAADEWARLAPVLTELQRARVPFSVDTYKPETMRRAIDAGAVMINDIYGFRQPGALEAVVGSGSGLGGSNGVALCVMHMQNAPKTMQDAPRYADVGQEVGNFLKARCEALQAAGVAAGRIWLDPGFGFGKTLDHNLALLRGLSELSRLGFPLLVGLSRKSMIGALTGRDVQHRAAGSVAAALVAAQNGARMLRVHDVRDTADALKVWWAVK
jgi:dihydropteroate synthase